MPPTAMAQRELVKETTVLLICRLALLIIAWNILVFSVALAKNQTIGPVPVETAFTAFAGTVGLFTSFAGFAVIDQLHPNILIVALELFVPLSYLTSAIALAVAMSDVASCSATDPTSKHSRFTNRIIGGGCISTATGLRCPNAINDGVDVTADRCETVLLGKVFLYFGIAFGLTLVVLGHAYRRLGRDDHPREHRYRV